MRKLFYEDKEQLEDLPSCITLEFLIIVYTRNMFFDKISLLHAVIKHYTIFAEAPAEARFFFFRPENFWKFGSKTLNFINIFVSYEHFSCAI